MIRMRKVLKGNWAHVRLSWATHFVELLNMLRDILHLADLARCRVYDGHIQDYVTSDTWVERFNVHGSRLKNPNWLLAKG